MSVVKNQVQVKTVDGKADIDEVKELDMLIASYKRRRYTHKDDIDKLMHNKLILEAEERRRNIIKKYDAWDSKLILKIVGMSLKCPDKMVMDELEGVLKCIGTVRVSDRRLNVRGGILYYKGVSVSEPVFLTSIVVKYSRYIAKGIKIPAMADDFLKFSEWLKQNEAAIASVIAEHDEPILNITPRTVYCHYRNDAEKKDEIRALEDVYAIQIYVRGSVINWRHEWNQDFRKIPGLPQLSLISQQHTNAVFLTESLVEQIPEIKDLFKRRDMLRSEYEEMPKKIHEAANKYMSKWLALAAL